MDQATRHYRDQEFNHAAEDQDHTPNLKINTKNGGTRWISISWEEFEEIRKVLTK